MTPADPGTTPVRVCHRATLPSVCHRDTLPPSVCHRPTLRRPLNVCHRATILTPVAATEPHYPVSATATLARVCHRDSPLPPPPSVWHNHTTTTYKLVAGHHIIRGVCRSVILSGTVPCQCGTEPRTARAPGGATFRRDSGVHAAPRSAACCGRGEESRIPQ